LLVRRNQGVSGDWLIDALWPAAGSAGGRERLRVAVSRLRKSLDEGGRPGDSALRTVAGGYLLAVAPGQLDADVFETGLADGQRTLEARDPDRARELLGDALALWRGPVFGGFPGGTLCQLAGARYEEYRMRALELLFDAELRLGHHAAVLAELAEAHTNHPLRERFCEQLMIALYGAGRQADALDVFHRMRRRLDDELGIQPSPALRRIESAILSHDPALSGDRLLQPA
jgi:DNA-binding SARP family transcriptional activator